MAVVYQAWDTKHEREVALKVLKPEIASAVLSERFHREVKTTAGLQHPHIVSSRAGAAGSVRWVVSPNLIKDQGESAYGAARFALSWVCRC